VLMYFFFWCHLLGFLRILPVADVVFFAL
jgi:hypothetical protein